MAQKVRVLVGSLDQMPLLNQQLDICIEEVDMPLVNVQTLIDHCIGYPTKIIVTLVFDTFEAELNKEDDDDDDDDDDGYIEAEETDHSDRY